MAGHDMWSNVERLKGALDTKRGKLFSRLAKEINLAARTGGDPQYGIPRPIRALIAPCAHAGNGTMRPWPSAQIFKKHDFVQESAAAAQFLRLAHAMEANAGLPHGRATANIPEEFLSRIAV